MGIKVDKLTIWKVKNKGYYLTNETGNTSDDKLEMFDEGIALDEDMLIDKVRSWINIEEL